MDYDLVVEGGEIVTGGGRYHASIGIRDGRIAAIAERLDGEAARRIDARGLAVLPGIVDAHTHFRDPAHQDKEDFTSGSRAAAAGGVTTFLEMPMSDVGTSTAERLRGRRELVAPKSLVDFGLYGGAGQQNLASIRDLAAEGAVGFKSFMREPYAARATNFEGTWVTDGGALYEIAAAVADTGLVWSVHAENFQIVQALERRLGDGAAATPETFTAIRPPFVEREPVARLVAHARETGARLHIAHITTRAGVDLVRRARASGLDVTCEVCIPHLVYTEKSIGDLAPLGYFTPRLRSDDDQAALWEGLRDGTVTLIASDHSSYTRQDVEAGWNGSARVLPSTATAGSASIEFMLPLVLTMVARGALPLQDAVAAMTERPARLFGLWPRKGAIRVGADADLTVVDLGRRWRIDAAAMRSKAKVSPFDGLEVVGLPLHTLVRGGPVLDGGEVVGHPGHGRCLSPGDQR